MNSPKESGNWAVAIYSLQPRTQDVESCTLRSSSAVMVAFFVLFPDMHITEDTWRKAAHTGCGTVKLKVRVSLSAHNFQLEISVMQISVL